MEQWYMAHVRQVSQSLLEGVMIENGLEPEVWYADQESDHDSIQATPIFPSIIHYKAGTISEGSHSGRDVVQVVMTCDVRSRSVTELDDLVASIQSAAQAGNIGFEDFENYRDEELDAFVWPINLLIMPQ